MKIVRTCPKCGLTHPENADLCDCGYDFSTGQMRPMTNLENAVRLINISLHRGASVEQITKVLMEKGMSEESARKLIKIAVASSEWATAQKYLKTSAALFIIALMITGVTYAFAVIRSGRVYYVAPITFLSSIIFFFKGLIKREESSTKLRQLEQSPLMPEAHTAPWYRRWFRKRRTPENDMK